MFVSEDIGASVARALYAGHCGFTNETMDKQRCHYGTVNIGTRLAKLRAEISQNRPSDRRVRKSLAAGIYQGVIEEDEDDEPLDFLTNTASRVDDKQQHLLSALVERESLSVICVTLYRHEYCLSLKSVDGSETQSERLGYDERELLDAIDRQELPPELVDLFDEADCNIFCSGCVVCEVRDYRSINTARSVNDTMCCTTLVLLRPTQCTMLADLRRLSERHGLSTAQRTELESLITLHTASPLCLDPSPSVGIVSTLALRSSAPLGSIFSLKRTAVSAFGAVGLSEEDVAHLPVPGGPLARLHGFLCQKRRFSPASLTENTVSSVSPVVAVKRARLIVARPVEMPMEIKAPQSVRDDVQKLARRMPLPPETSRDSSLRLREENSVEWDRGGGRVMHMTLSILVRPSDESYHGRLYVDRDFQEGRRSGASCQFRLCCRAASELYVRQCIEIFTEYGKKSAKLTHQTAGQQPRITYTRGARERQDHCQLNHHSQQAQLQQQHAIADQSKYQSQHQQQQQPQQLLVASPLSSVHQQQQQQRLVRAGQQQLRGQRPVDSSSAAAVPTLAAQLSRPPLVVRAAFSGGGNVASRLIRPLAPSGAQSRVHMPAIAAEQTGKPVSGAATPGQTIQIKVSGQSDQLAQMLQTQLQSIQVPMVQPAPLNQKRVTVSVTGSNLQALLSTPPVVTAVSPSIISSPTIACSPSLLEKLVARSSAVGGVKPSVPPASSPSRCTLRARMTATTAASAPLGTPPSRAELQNPTLTELLNAPLVGSRGTANVVSTSAPGTASTAGAVVLTNSDALSAGSTSTSTATNQDLLTAALQLVQNGDLINELENLESMLTDQQQNEAQSTALKLEQTSLGNAVPSAAPTHGRLLIRSEQPPPNVNIMNLTPTAAADTATVPPQSLQNVQLSIPGLCAPISINVGTPSVSQQQLITSQQPTNVLPPTASFQLLRPTMSGSQRVFAVSPGAQSATPQRVLLSAGTPHAPAVSSVLAGGQPVIITSPVAVDQHGPSRQQVLLSPPSTVQRVIISRSPQHQQQQIVLTPAAGVAISAPMSMVQLRPEQLHGLVTVTTAASKPATLTAQQRAQLLQQQKRQ